MDDADIRRGRQTVHKKWDQNVAILSGDAAAIVAYMYLVKCDDKYLRQSVDIFNKVAMDVCKGQQYDMEFEERMDVNCEEYTHMIYLKTAALIAGSLKLGAALGDATAEEAQLLYDFGKYLGIAFQLQDDHLDVYGDVAVFGKKIGGDIISNKKTFLLIKALEMAEGETRERLLKWIDKKNFDAQEKIEAVRTIYDELGVEDVTKKEIVSYIDKSIDVLKKIDVEEDRKKGFYEMVNVLKDRVY
jgi:geranylgeranyl diphosphate synthase type II